MRIHFLLAASAIVAISAQGQAQTATPGAPAPSASERPIVITGNREAEDEPSLITKLRDMIDETGTSQMARFEASICPMVIGMPRDLTAVITRIIRENIVEAGGELGKPGCKVNAAAIFIDQPHQLITRLHKAEPFFFMNMTPREFVNFSAKPRPVYSWHTSNTYTKDGGYMSGTAKSDGTRLYTPIRDEMESGIVVIDRQATIGKNVRQLADFATMHLMLEVNWRARRVDQGSILALFQNRNPNPAARMSSLDRNALRGFYTLKENNQTAANQRQNIVRAIKRQEEGKPVSGAKPDR